jgi:hypothetical protein
MLGANSPDSTTPQAAVMTTILVRFCVAIASVDAKAEDWLTL